MFHSRVPDVAAGLFFLYAVLSLICTVVNEWVVAATRLRARSLQAAVWLLLDDAKTGLGRAFYRHPAIESAMAAGRGRPEYLDPELFARVLADLIVGPCPKVYGWQRAINDLPACRLRATLAFLLGDAQPEEATPRLAAWFEGSMRHLSAWYKGRLQAISCMVAVTVCVALDADTLRVARLVWGAPVSPTCIARGTGWVLTAIAVSRGAPFWFELLKRMGHGREGRS